MSGWIKLHRSSLEHWLYTENRPLTKREAWETILLKVNYTESKTLIKGQLYNCEAGQSLLSLNSWAKEFLWSVQQVRTFFKMLEKDNMITLEGMQYTTRLTVCKWNTYQELQHTANTPLTDGQHTANTPITTIKEREEIKKEKNYKKLLLSEIKISDYPELNENYFNIALSFQEIIKNNIIQFGGSVKNIENSKGNCIDEIRLLIETDKFTIEDCQKVFVFLRDEIPKNQFSWKKNILSIKKLREKFNKLLIESKNGTYKQTYSTTKQGTTDQELAEIFIKHFGSTEN